MIFKTGPNFFNYVQYFQTMPNRFFQGGKYFSRGGFDPPAPPWIRACY